MPEPFVTTVDAREVVWRLPDPAGALTAVRLWTDLPIGDSWLTRDGAGWELRRSRAALPPVDRLEYLFETTRDGRTASVLDPGNPRRVGGAFGDHSWVALDYRPPSWLDLPARPGRREPLVVGTPVGPVEAQVWTPAGTGPNETGPNGTGPNDTGPDSALPLLLSHDGPEMDAFGELTRYVGAMVGTGRLPPLRVGLLAPGSRDERYAASTPYAAALCRVVVPALLDRWPTRGRPVLVGQSLGALAALHAEWRHPGTFAGLLLQSGSFFTPDLDPQESGFPHWAAVTGFVAEVLTATTAPSTAPVGVCFGTAEENAANNRRLAAALAALGVPVTLGEVRDGHTWTCWRDLLDPHLTDLLTRTC